MKVGGRNSVRGIVAASVLAVLAFILLVQYAPDSVAFSPNNYGWNGLRDVAAEFSLNYTTSLSTLPADGVLAVLQPSQNFSPADAQAVRNFLLGGGTVLVADKSGVANSLLRGLGAAIAIESSITISDSVYNWKSASVPTALVLPAVRASYLANVSGIALSQPSPLELTGSDASQVAITSQFSQTQAGARGPFVVMASESIGAGTLVVVGDSQFLLNSEWTIANNRVLIGNLFANRSVFIDASHWMVSPLASSIAQLKAELGGVYATISGVPLKYAFVLLMAGLALLLVPQEEHGDEGVAPGQSGVPNGLRAFNCVREGAGSQIERYIDAGQS